MSKVKRLAIIPARSGSKRLERKNVRDFHGAPILHYTIKAAIDTNCFTKIIISSDSSEILDLASNFPVSLHQRSTSLSSDAARIVDVCLEIISEERDQGNDYDQICVLYATAPMRTAHDIQAVLSLLDLSECNFAIAATHFSHYPFQALKILNKNFVKPMWPELSTKRADQIGELIAGNGSTYAAKIKAFEDNKEFYGPNMRYYLMPKIRSIDIDTIDDWKLAEAAFSALQDE
jgi:pseudaminic acid cytidylyltransferase